MITLPVDAILPELCAAVRARGVAVVVAPPGSGKTTRVPGALLDAGLAGDGKVVVLQPRRIAARATARWIAEQRGGRVGGEVGYSVRFERRVSGGTRLEVVTEGMLTRRLQADPFLSEVGLVVLDEFHERSVHADLALAMLAEVRQQARPDLGIVVMSATLDAEPIARFLGEFARGGSTPAPIVRCAGRMFDVAVEYAPGTAATRPDDHVAAVIRRCLGEMARDERTAGDILCFLPGVGAIRRVSEGLAGRVNAVVLPLHGSLPAAAQDLALRPHDRRKVVLATNVAETSLTIDGIACVVDSGQVRAPELDLITGLTRLVQRRASDASVSQRAGRAGRTGPGTCVRVWSQPEQRALRPFDPPQIACLDLTETVLQVRAWGADPRAFGWFEGPADAELTRCDAVLSGIGAVRDDSLTPLGRRLADIPAHPRAAAVLLAGDAAGKRTEAATLAALLQEGDIYSRPPAVRADDDVAIRLLALQADARGLLLDGVDRGRSRRVTAVRDALLRSLPSPTRDTHKKAEKSVAQLAIAGFGDRVARLRPGSDDRYLLVGGAGARLAERSAVRGQPILVAVSLRATGRGEGAEHLIDLACAIDPTELPTTKRLHVRFDSERRAVVAHKQTMYRDLVLHEHPEPCPAAVAAEVLQKAARAQPTRAFALDRDAATLLSRLRWLAVTMPELALPTFAALDTPTDPDATEHTHDATLDDANVADATLDDALLGAACAGCRSFADLQKKDLGALMRGLLPGTASAALAKHAPERIDLPNGRSAAIVYAPGADPVLAARIQDFFGLQQTPRIAAGRVPLVLHLLAPNRRPVQVTRDLASFWSTTYPEVRKTLRGRYVKHRWPEDPLGAT